MLNVPVRANAQRTNEAITTVDANNGDRPQSNTSTGPKLRMHDASPRRGPTASTCAGTHTETSRNANGSYGGHGFVMLSTRAISAYCDATPQFACVPFGLPELRDEVAVQGTKLTLTSLLPIMLLAC